MAESIFCPLDGAKNLLEIGWLHSKLQSSIHERVLSCISFALIADRLLDSLAVRPAIYLLKEALQEVVKYTLWLLKVSELGNLAR